MPRVLGGSWGGGGGLLWARYPCRSAQLPFSEGGGFCHEEAPEPKGFKHFLLNHNLIFLMFILLLLYFTFKVRIFSRAGLFRKHQIEVWSLCISCG